MVEKRQTEEMSRAADRLVEAVDEFTRQVERMRPSEPLSEEEADRIGNEAVHEYRREASAGAVSEAGGFDRDRGPLTDEEIEEWTRRREERRRREGRKPI